MTQQEIEDRIKAEYVKHHAAGLDWAKIAAAKIHKVLELERERLDNPKNPDHEERLD